MGRAYNGRQSEELLNSELYKIFEIIKNINSSPTDTSIGPITNQEKSLWLDNSLGKGDLKYYSEGQWKLLFEERFKTISDIMSPSEPTNPSSGQLWISDGVLMYFNGTEWTPIKSINIENNVSLSSFEQFLIINPLNQSGSNVVEYEDTDGDGSLETIYKSQFLVPDVTMDRFFLNGYLVYDYDVISNVAIQYETDKIQGKYSSAIHVNPSNLKSINKKVILVDKNTGIIPILEYNTEFYGMSGGVCRLLLKTSDSSTDYISTAQGIQLSNLNKTVYDYVFAITYVFKTSKNQGSLTRGSLLLNNNSSIYIGSISDPINVFVKGLYLSDIDGNYTYNTSTGYINFTDQVNLEVGIISFCKKETGIITSLTTDFKGIINVSDTYTKPLVFVYGESLQGLVDYEEVIEESKLKLLIKDAKVGMHYSIVETYGEKEEDQIFYSSGITTSNEIVCPFTDIDGDTKVILFLNGLLISSNDIERDNVTGNITCNGLGPDIQYTLLKDTHGREIFNDEVSFVTIPTNNIDNALVYVENHLICDSSSVYVNQLPLTGTIGEVKLLISNGLEQWYKYSTGAIWEPILDDAICTDLYGSTIQYSTSKKSISILQNFGSVRCDYLGYTYANTIEEPLLRGKMTINKDESIYEVAFNHTYVLNTNSLSIWINGLRQYQNTSLTNEINGVKELSFSSFELPAPINGNLFYVIERPEGTETISCQREVLDLDSCIVGTMGVYKTKIPLSPGNIRVFISGLRQPTTAYKIIDKYTLMINDEIIGSTNNYPTESSLVDNNLVTVTHKTYDKILIETRQDYNLKEITIPIRYPGQNIFSALSKNSLDILQGGDGLPESLFESTDFIMIYINGLAYGKEYSLDSENQTITLKNEEFTSRLGIDYIKQYFQDNPEAYLEWKQNNNFNEYESQSSLDKITFEWR